MPSGRTKNDFIGGMKKRMGMIVDCTCVIGSYVMFRVVVARDWKEKLRSNRLLVSGIVWES